MAQKPDGKPARTERVTFTKPAAERIAKVVRAVEGGDRDAGPLTFGNRGVGGGNVKAFRVCTFTGAWFLNTVKAVTYYNQTTTPNTVAVQNVLFPLPQLSDTTTSPTVGCIGKDGTAWYLINVLHSDHDVLTGAALNSSALEFTKRTGLTISVTATTTSIGASSCDTKASSAQLSSFLG